MKKLGTIGCLAFILIILGGLNVGLIGIFDLNLFSDIFGRLPALIRLFYVLVGLSAIYFLYLQIKGKT